MREGGREGGREPHMIGCFEPTLRESARPCHNHTAGRDGRRWDRQTDSGRADIVFKGHEGAQSILVDVSDLTNKSKILIHEREERAKERRKDRDQGNHIQTGILI
jgi:hypothetical protein